MIAEVGLIPDYLRIEESGPNERFPLAVLKQLKR